MISVGVSALLLLFGIGGGSSTGAETLKGGAEEPYNALPNRYVELPGENFGTYWTGKKIFPTESAVRLALPVLKAPEPREEEMPVPPFHPGPAWELYNKLGGPVKYPMLIPGAPAIAEANLPSAAEIAELGKLEEPAQQGKPDLRDKKDREFALIELKSGAKWEALEITDQNVGGWLMYKDKAGNRKRVALGEVKNVLTNNSHQRQYELDSESLQKYGAKEADERVKLAQRCLEQGMIPEAKAELKKAIEAKKDHLDAILLLGQLASDTSDFETALATYRGGLDAGGPAGELWYEIGRVLRAISLHEGALAAFEKSVESQPRLHRGRIALARAHLEMGGHAAAIETATDFFTKLGTAPDTTPAHRAEAYVVRGLAYVRAGQLDKARADFAETLKIEPANAEAFNGNGAAFALEGQFPQAGPEFVKAIKANQYLTDAWTNLAALLLLGGKWADAETIAAAAVQRDPASADAFLCLGLAQLLAAKKEAPATLVRAEQADPRNLHVLMVSGLLLLRQGQDEEALQKFVTALRSEYFFLPAYSGAAAAYLRTARKLAMGKDEASARKASELRINAATLLQKIRDFDPNRPGAWLGLGIAYAAMRRPEDARNALRNAGGNDPLLFYTRGYIEYYHGEGEDRDRVELAKREFDQAVKLETTATDPVSQRVIGDCKTAIEQMMAWKHTAQRLLMTFDGPDAKQIGPGWLESENNYNVQISREKGRGKFAGKQAVKDWGLTSLLHEFQGADFQTLEVTLYPEKVEKAECGISLFTTKNGDRWQGLSIGFDQNGKAKYAMNLSDHDMDGFDFSVGGWIDFKVQPPNPKEILIRVSVTEKNRARFFNISWWNPAKSEWMLAKDQLGFAANAQGAWRMGTWIRAWRDQDVQMFVDNIKILEQVRR
jgi:tetratricopeptide (TPR) repeat protein